MSADNPIDPASSKAALNAKVASQTPSAAVIKLMGVGKAIVTAKAFQPTDGKTFCNYAVSSAAKSYGYSGFSVNNEPLMANAIISKMNSDKAHWSKVTALDAWDAALQGKLAIAFISETPHGHVAVVAPLPRVWSDKWSGYCPPVYNVGKTVNTKPPYTMGENFAFLYQPGHYVYMP
jgi:hypothetical protein